VSLICRCTVGSSFLQVNVDGRTLQRDTRREQGEQDYQAALQHGTVIRLGNLTYRLVYTDLNQEQQQLELEEALKRTSAENTKSVILLSPTPSKPTIDYHGYSIFDAHRHGTTSTVSLGYDKSNGKPVAVKIVKCTRAQFSDIRKEIEIIVRLNHVGRRSNLTNVNDLLSRRTYVNLTRSSIGIRLLIHLPGVLMNAERWASSCHRQQPPEPWSYLHHGSFILILPHSSETLCTK
jgi:hypothetical protein